MNLPGVNLNPYKAAERLAEKYPAGILKFKRRLCLFGSFWWIFMNTAYSIRKKKDQLTIKP